MTNYFTISEFAKLRNININSLRYYEKIGVLKPARVDARTGYRYYSPDQLPILDVILLCIDFGMPLRDLAEYMKDDAFIRNKELFETGRKLALQRMNDLQMELDKIDYTLQYLSVNQQFCERTGTYTRVIPERRIVTLDYTGAPDDIRKIEMATGKLYGYAQEKRLSPVFPAGLLIRSDGAEPTMQVFFEIVGKNTADPSVRTLPAGEFLCRQIDLTPKIRLTDLIEATFGEAICGEIIVANMLLDKYQLGTKKSELQTRVK